MVSSQLDLGLINISRYGTGDLSRLVAYADASFASHLDGKDTLDCTGEPHHLVQSTGSRRLLLRLLEYRGRVSRGISRCNV